VNSGEVRLSEGSSAAFWGSLETTERWTMIGVVR
jgi:hypothetical protein